MNIKLFKHIQLLFLVCLIILLTCSCGGGTAGTSGTTDGRLRTISGIILNSEGQPLQSALVSVEETSFTSTDGLGRYSLQATVNNQFNMNITTDKSNAVVTIKNIDEASETITVDAKLSSNQNQAEVSFISSRVESGNCGSLVKVAGTDLTLKVPASGLNCNLEYIFTIGGNLTTDGKLVVSETTCRNLETNTFGNQLDGNKLTLFQELSIGNIQQDCTAKVVAEFPGLVSNPSFSLKFSRETENTDSDPALNLSYSGTLRELDGSDLESCTRFKEDRMLLTFSVKAGQINASIPSEQLSIDSKVNKEASNDLNRYSVNTTLADDSTLSFGPAESLGASKVRFTLLYVEAGGSCQKGFTGILSKN